MANSLLPPNATPFERALDLATASIGDVDVPLDRLLNPATCDIALLPWLAWALSADWNADWSEAQKRSAVAGAIAMHRIRGTPASVKAVLARFDDLLELVEGYTVGATPGTFEVHLPLGAEGGTRATAAFAEAIIRDVQRVKPVSRHFEMVQTFAADAAIGVSAAARAVRFDRMTGAGATDTDPSWLTFLQTEDGEPIANERGTFLVEA